MSGPRSSLVVIKHECLRCLSAEPVLSCCSLLQSHSVLGVSSSHILGKREGRRDTARWWDKTGQTASQTEAGILRSACMHGSQSPQQRYDLYPSLLFLSDPVPSLSQR